MAAAHPRFAMNHMVAPNRSLKDFIAIAKRTGVDAIEIRNDLAGIAILDGTPPEAVKALAGEAGLRIITINALQRFNDWSATREKEARALIDYSARCGSEGLILVPTNDGTGRADNERVPRATAALKALKPMLADAGVTGLVECLGFTACSLRSKREAAEAIDAAGGGGTVFKLVHDTFHHHLAGEAQTFPKLTGLVHISGVVNPKVTVETMTDADRVLVDAQDRVDNVGQIRRLLSEGYGGYFSFEPFSKELESLADPAAALKTSMAFITGKLG